MCVLTAAASWIAAGYDLGELRAVEMIQQGVELGTRERVARSEAGRLLGSVQLACCALLATLFLPWLYHARVNVRALGARQLRFRREWAYLAFLVPGLNLVRPCQVLSEIWRGSDPDREDPLAGTERRPPARIVLWWAGFVVFALCQLAAVLLLEHVTGLAQRQLGHGLSLVGNVSGALSASLATFLVMGISRAQELRWRTYGDASEPGATLASGAPA